MIKFSDRVSVGKTKTTSDGYLVATARVARTGVQEYLASELGDIALSAGFQPNDVVRVNRPESEVFSEDALNSITRVPVTVNHPTESVTADNWSRLAVGEVGDSYARDGQWIVVNPMIKDAAAIKAAKTTHKEISMGYTAEIVEAADKSVADFEMKNIFYNHVALVEKARAGADARIGDSWGAIPMGDNETGGKPNNCNKGGLMTEKTVVLGDSAVQVSASDAAIIEQFKVGMVKQLADAQTLIETKDSEIGELKVELADAKKAAEIDVDALVAARSDLVAQIKAIDASIETAGKSDTELRKTAVAKVMGDESIADASDAQIEGMFKAVSKLAKAGNPVADAFKEGVKTITNDAAALADEAHKKAIHDLNAWRNA